MSHRHLLLALASAKGLQRDAMCRLAAEPAAWLGSGPPDLTARRLGVTRDQIERGRAVAADADAIAARASAEATRHGVDLVVRGDPAYPQPLRDLELPPPVLWVRGRLADRPAVGIVGSRAADAYGLEVAELFGRELAAAGLSVVSGFARGVDTAAHRGALAAAGGHTVAVLGNGLDVDYPRGHRRLAERIARQGAVISEFPLATPPRNWHFPVRNRIIAALSLGVLVAQAAPRSGSLITARLAVELGRDVYAVPAPIFEARGSGPNTLIRDGALPVQRPRDVIESLPSAVRERLVRRPGDDADRRPADAPSGDAGRVLGSLAQGRPRTADEVADAAGLPLPTVLAALVELEIAGWLRRYPGPAFTRRLEPER